MEWISVKDELPEENCAVLIWCGSCNVAKLEKGISTKQRKAMKQGEMQDSVETAWCVSRGFFQVKRSDAHRACDEWGNNKVPYCWHGVNNPMKWYGQDVTHWAYLPLPPKEDA